MLLQFLNIPNSYQASFLWSEVPPPELPRLQLPPLPPLPQAPLAPLAPLALLAPRSYTRPSGSCEMFKLETSDRNHLVGQAALDQVITSESWLPYRNLYN